MYFGTYDTVLDDKNRVTAPRKIRDTMDVLGHAVWYMARGYDHSISLFPQHVWNTIREHVNKYSSMDAKALDFRRLLFASVTELRPDRQGRIPVPLHLREHAGLERDAVLIGVDEYLELWSRDHWRAFQERHQPQFKEMATALFSGTPGDGHSGVGSGQDMRNGERTNEA
ncbi:MAG TPA: division/cell wall cluster transcriptional repressor MraZ [Candidatus Hydrogenedentes bacterium]|nr:division/cell wall cluster transcriptional repressor MraZ [Candidatus Hydrogenedentota bacterium]HPG68094.1 division/cell wall cluster transcriptional repressor MraZ [Candidatus Hydrogenedentota bacterium]